MRDPGDVSRTSHTRYLKTKKGHGAHALTRARSDIEKRLRRDFCCPYRKFRAQSVARTWHLGEQSHRETMYKLSIHGQSCPRTGGKSASGLGMPSVSGKPARTSPLGHNPTRCSREGRLAKTDARCGAQSRSYKGTSTPRSRKHA